ncbi:hypothetical protein [Eubacterium aggregans]|nr:hypothetical protein [Eubacterium aggregans]
MMKKQDGDLSDSFRRRNDAIALKAINAVLLMFEIKAERMQAYQCKTCGNELMVDDDTHFCPFCGRAIR